MNQLSLPNDWESMKLKDVASFKNGLNFSKDKVGRGLQVVDVLNMYGAGIGIDNSSLYRVNINVADDYLLRENDILFVRSSLKREGVGWSAIFNGDIEPMSFCGFLIRARLKTSKLLPLFIAYYLRSPIARQKTIALSGTVAITNINQVGLGLLDVPVPSEGEQRKIAEILSTVDEAIEKTDAIIEETRQLKKGLMQKLFTEGIGHTQFKDTKIGRIPEEWQVRRADEVCHKVTDGTHDTPKPTPKGKLLVTSKNIKDGKLTFDQCYFISEDDYREVVKRSKVEQYDVLYGMIGASVGYAALVTNVNVDFAIKNVGVFKSGGDPRLGEWLYNYFSSGKAIKYVTRQKGGAARDFAPLGLLRKFPIPIPSNQEIEKINCIFSVVNKKIENEEAYRAELEQLKKGLMQVLLTGKVRVKVDENEKEAEV